MGVTQQEVLPHPYSAVKLYSVFRIIFRVSLADGDNPLVVERNQRKCFCQVQLRLEVTMLWTIFVILLVLWLLGLVSSYTLGGFIHLLLVLAIVVLVINLLSGRRTAL